MVGLAITIVIYQEILTNGDFLIFSFSLRNKKLQFTKHQQILNIYGKQHIDQV